MQITKLLKGLLNWWQKWPLSSKNFLCGGRVKDKIVKIWKIWSIAWNRRYNENTGKRDHNYWVLTGGLYRKLHLSWALKFEDYLTGKAWGRRKDIRSVGWWGGNSQRQGSMQFWGNDRWSWQKCCLMQAMFLGEDIRQSDWGTVIEGV